ncbi:LamG-like jellyroll fold domain-containing protein [Corallibacter sp.]|uniref:LamG-like jellyroll fold domain-containing protein n=1 Tax=Corallibacter sp. TaxID=2038084 RepID=UPI003AB7C5F5
MKKIILFVVLFCTISYSFSQISETEPNNTIDASGVITITEDGTFIGSFNQYDIEYFKIKSHAVGNVTFDWISAPAGNGLYIYEDDANYGSTYLTRALNPGQVTVTLNPNKYYTVRLHTGTAAGSWSFSVSGLKFAPVISTSTATAITKTSTIIGGNITSDNGNAVTERGIIYSNSDSTPEIGEAGVTKEDEGGLGTGVFSETISGLTKNTLYYYRAYAINDNGTSYGNIESFITLNPIPILTTSDATSITKTTATLEGNITSNNGNAITERGIIYSTTDTTPEIGETGVIKETIGTGTGVYSENITGLTGETTYYYRAYAINSEGTGYGAIKSFTTLGVSVTSIERENPSLENLYENTVTYKVTFSKPVKDVDVSDFTTNSLGATINTINQISTTVYEVTLNNITAIGDVFLQIKGIDGISGSNNISTLAAIATPNITVNQTATNDYLNQAKIGQTYTAGINGVLKKVTFYPKDGNHTFSGTADLKIYSGNETNGGIEIHSESINITNSTVATGQEFTLSSTVNVSQGSIYSVVLTNFSGSGSHALNSITTDVYANGHVIFTGMNNSSHLNFDLKIKIEEETNALAGDITLSTTAPTTNEKYKKTDLPAIETTNATNVASTSVTLAGNIIHQGESAVIERGVLYSATDTNPKIGDTNVTKDTNGAGTGVFSENITGLTATTGYFFRAYATNSQGTAYGNVKRFNFNHSLNFDGINDRVVIEDNTAFNFSSGFTAEAWINPDELSTQTIISQYSDNQKAFACILLASGKIEFSISLGGSSEYYFESTDAISAGQWSHIAVTFDGATMKTYINGVAAGTKTVGGTMHNSTANIEIGARNNAYFFNGNIDEVRIWNIALLEHHINSNKDTSMPTTNVLIASYNMNQGIAFGDNTSITTLKNNGSNILNGTLENFTKTGETSNFITGVTGAFGNAISNNTFSTTGSWSTASNWSLGIVPTQIDKAIIGSGKTVTLDVDDLKIDDFELENGAVLNIPKDKEITIQNSFNSSGTLELSSDKTNSGVLLVEGTSTGTVTYKRGGLLANKWSIVTPPVAGQKIKAFAENVANNIRKRTDVTPNKYAISYYDDSQPSGQKWVYYFADMDENLEFEVGKSYAISRATDGEISFTGTLTTDTTTKTVTTNQWNAIGNPFTTYFPANKNGSNSFLNDNLTALDDTYQSIYVWDNAQNKYVVVSEVDDANRTLTPGQGFFVKLKNGQTNITFNEEKRSIKPVAGNNLFEKTKNTTPTINVFLSDGNHTVNTAIKYFDNTTTGFDKGYDIGNFNSDGLDVFTRLVDGSHNTNFTIQSLPKDDYENMVIPIGINAKANSEITFSLTKENIPDMYHVFLEDNVLKTFHQLDKENATYKISISEDTNTAERFSVHITTQVLSLEKLHQNNLNVYLSNKRTLSITGLNNQKATIKIISILGKELLNKTIHNTTLQIPDALKAGIYIVKIASNKGNITKKIILE